MGDIERLTITLPAEMAELVKGAVDDGDYASSSEVIREALRDWLSATTAFGKTVIGAWLIARRAVRALFHRSRRPPTAALPYRFKVL